MKKSEKKRSYRIAEIVEFNSSPTLKSIVYCIDFQGHVIKFAIRKDGTLTRI